MDFGFPAMLAILFLQGDAWLLRQTLAVCLLHELGHGAAMLITRAGIREIRFYAAGMQLRTRAVLLSVGQELAVLLSGPAVNLLAAALLYLCHGSRVLMGLHLGMGCFNLLPYRILDGGAALRCLSGEKLWVQEMLTGLCVMLSLCGVILLGMHGIQNPWLYLMAVYLAVAELGHHRTKNA
jgi:hypothetical protein